MTARSIASTSSSSSSASGQDVSPDRVVILYASETGNAQDVAERVGREFRRLGRRCVVLSMDTFDVFELPDIQFLILITSTHGRGDPPPAMLPLWTALLRTSLPPDILEDVNFALFGLGDSSYERFCYAGKMLARRMEGLGAMKIGEPAWGDERAPNGIEETLLPWMEQTLGLMLPHLPLPPPGFTISPSTSLPPPVYALDRQSVRLPSINGLSLSNAINGRAGSEAAPARTSDEINGHGVGCVKPDDWTWARLTHKKRVTADEWWQDVREIELESEDPNEASYLPGSICNLQPRTSGEEVQRFLEMMDLRDKADEPCRVRCLVEDQPLPPHFPPSETPTTLRSLLTNHLDLRNPPRKSFFEWLRRLTPDERERGRLDEFIQDPDEIHTYATRPSRTVLETLGDFGHTRLPLSHVLEILPPLRRRQFSIASSSNAHPGKVQLLIALVEYKTNLKAPRKGLCSSWLDGLAIGTRLPIKISPPTMQLPSDPSTPVILVGPGTGVAPMRAFLEERVRQGAASNTILYFGCRSTSFDLFYASEWASYRKQGSIIEVAASRDQEEKVYVQHLIRRDKELVHEWIVDRLGSIYISGSSNTMPKEVREAIAWCISVEGAGTLKEEEAKGYVEEMFDVGRGGEESW